MAITAAVLKLSFLLLGTFNYSFLFPGKSKLAINVAEIPGNVTLRMVDKFTNPLSSIGSAIKIIDR
jgi:hypothetical protein